jgi:GNAT superfamily N-acetyltransferase
MPGYRIRPATDDDVDVLVHHRIAMFRDMGTPMNEEKVAREFKRWVSEMLPVGTYRGWVVETAGSESGSSHEREASPAVVAGGGICIFPWPPGPQSFGDRLAFVYNVYTEPGHRRQGLARRVMEAIHAWCRESGIGALALNSSDEGQSLYESLGYRIRINPMMVCELKSMAEDRG